jgi:uncharacterized membrane protein YfcA
MLLVLLLTAVVASALNAMAGGGTFISFPALTGLANLSAKAANITSTVGLWPGYAASVVAARSELLALGRRTGLAYAAVGAAGGVGGAVLLLTTSTTVFAKLVPWLLAFSTILFAAGPTIRRWASRQGSDARPTKPTSPLVLVIVLTIALYTGYFGAGGGVLLIAGLAALMPGDVRRLNVLKVIIQTSANATAIVVFLSAGIDWHIAAAMAAGAALGGFVGMRLANHMSERALYWVILTVAATLTVVYFVKTSP